MTPIASLHPTTIEPYKNVDSFVKDGFHTRKTDVLLNILTWVKLQLQDDREKDIWKWYTDIARIAQDTVASIDVILNSYRWLQDEEWIQLWRKIWKLRYDSLGRVLILLWKNFRNEGIEDVVIHVGRLLSVSRPYMEANFKVAPEIEIPKAYKKEAA